MYTFDSFVVSAASHDVWSAALSVAENRARAPLVLLGPCGSGKSHLLHAIEQEMRVRRPGANVVRLPVAELTDWLVHAYRNDTMKDFERRLASLDALLVDDMRLLADKPYIEQLLIAHLGTLAAQGLCIVVTSDRPLGVPLAGARVVTLGYPDEAARVEIARRIAEEQGVALPDNVLRLVSNRRSAPELRSRILRLAAEAQLEAERGAR